MANWQTDATSSTFETAPYASAAIDARSADRAGSSWTIGGIGNMNVVGINAAGVEGVRDTIRTAVTNVQTVVDQVGKNAESSTAYKSEVVKPQVDAYIESVKEYCKAVLSNLLAFSDKLKDVQDAWETSMGSMSTTVGGATSGMSNYSTRYTEQK